MPLPTALAEEPAGSPLPDRNHGERHVNGKRAARDAPDIFGAALKRYCKRNHERLPAFTRHIARIRDVGNTRRKLQ
jgi:hypothetical protein